MIKTAWTDGFWGDHVNYDVATHNKWGVDSEPSQRKGFLEPPSEAAKIYLPDNQDAYRTREQAKKDVKNANQQARRDEILEKIGLAYTGTQTIEITDRNGRVVDTIEMSAYAPK